MQTKADSAVSLVMLVGAVVVGLVGLLLVRACSAGVPDSLRGVFDAEVARAGVAGWRSQLAAQVWIESHWRPDVSSPWAHGLAQFTPPTWSDIAPVTDPSCAGVSMFDPACSLRAQIVYMRKLRRRYFFSGSDADRWAFAWAAYNGGPGWISREKRQCRKDPRCDAARWYRHVERHCRRAAWACRENRAYPVKIARALERFREPAGKSAAVGGASHHRPGAAP